MTRPPPAPAHPGEPASPALGRHRPAASAPQTLTEPDPPVPDPPAPALTEPEPRAAARLTALLLLCCALVSGWGVWGALRPPLQPVTVTREALPLPAESERTAAVYPMTGSITPLISGRLNLNTASDEQLQALPGIGPALAGRIREARPLRGLDDLDAVRGIGPVLLERLGPLVSF